MKEKIENFELSDGVIALRPFRIEDAKAHLAGEDSEHIKWLNDGHASSIESVERWIERNKKFWENNGPVFNFSIRTADGKIIGMVEANVDDKTIEGLKHGQANISYALYPAARSKGYMSHVLTLIEDFLRSRGIKEAIIRANPENKASIYVPKRAGFKEIGHVQTKEGDVLAVFVKAL